MLFVLKWSVPLYVLYLCLFSRESHSQLFVTVKARGGDKVNKQTSIPVEVSEEWFAVWLKNGAFTI